MNERLIQAPSVIERAETYARGKNLTMFFQYDIFEMRYDFLFQKYNYVTRAYIDPSIIKNEEEFEQTLCRLIDEANELLESCKY